MAAQVECDTTKMLSKMFDYGKPDLSAKTRRVRKQQIRAVSPEVIPSDFRSIRTRQRFHAKQATVVCIETLDAVLAANSAYYEAFEMCDMDAMSDVWEHSDRATCTHPG